MYSKLFAPVTCIFVRMRAHLFEAISVRRRTCKLCCPTPRLRPRPLPRGYRGGR